MSKMDFQYLILTRQKCTVQCETANTRSRILAIAHKGDAKTISGEPFLQFSRFQQIFFVRFMCIIRKDEYENHSPLRYPYLGMEIQYSFRSRQSEWNGSTGSYIHTFLVYVLTYSMAQSTYTVYLEYHSVRPLVLIWTPPPLHPQANMPPPLPRGTLADYKHTSLKVFDFLILILNFEKEFKVLRRLMPKSI